MNIIFLKHLLPIYYQTFDGNSDRFDPNTAYLNPAMVGRFIQIESLDFHVDICFSFEMYGCFLAQEDRDCMYLYYLIIGLL